MAVVCPTVTASNEADYARQINNVKNFASRIHIDLMDGQFAPSLSVDVTKIWLPDSLLADVHVMYNSPMNLLDDLARLKPNLVVIHQEANVDHRQFAGELHKCNIKAALALLPDTTLDSAREILGYFDQLLIFGGHLGYQGGHADLSLLAKVSQAKELYPSIEIAWDGGINDQNAPVLVKAGVDILNVGAFIQSSPDPEAAYAKIFSSLGT